MPLADVAAEALADRGNTADWKSQWPELQNMAAGAKQNGSMNIASNVAQSKDGRIGNAGSVSDGPTCIPKLTLEHASSTVMFKAPLSIQPKTAPPLNTASNPATVPLLSGFPELAPSMKAPGPTDVNTLGAIPKDKGPLASVVSKAIAVIAKAGGVSGLMDSAVASAEMPAELPANAPENVMAETSASFQIDSVAEMSAATLKSVPEDLLAAPAANGLTNSLADPLCGTGTSLGVPQFLSLPLLGNDNMAGVVQGHKNASVEEPEPKRLRVSTEVHTETTSMNTTKENALMRPTDGDAVNTVASDAIVLDEDQKWQDQWAEVFKLMHEGDMQARAGEYAEAVVALKKNAEDLRRQHKTVQSSCEQLLHTAYREALQSHLRSMLEAAFVGVSPEVAEAARKTVEELTPPVTAVSQPKPKMQASASLINVSKSGAAYTQPGAFPPPQPAKVASMQTSFMGLPGIAASSTMNTTAIGTQIVPKSKSIPIQLGKQPQQFQPQQLQPPQQQQQPQQSQQPQQQPQFAQLGGGPVASSAAVQDSTLHSNLWVGGLPDGIDDGMFQTLFARYGAILSIKLVADKRYGFVKFGSKSEAQSAIDALNGFECNGVKLQVRFADRDRGSPLGTPGQSNSVPVRLPALGIGLPTLVTSGKGFEGLGDIIGNQLL